MIYNINIKEDAIACSTVLTMLGYKQNEIEQKSFTDLFKAVKDRIVSKFSTNPIHHKNLLQASLEYMKSHEDTIKDGAAIASNLKQFNKTVPWKIHQGGTLFNHIKKMGSELTGLSKDKWNPSDFFLVTKNGENTLSTVSANDTDYAIYNEMVGCSEDICGVSLKGKRAFHGSLSWAVALKMLGINIVESKIGRKHFVDESKKELNEDGKEALKKMVRFLSSFNKPGGEIFQGYNTSRRTMNEVIEAYHVESRGWGESMIGFYDFFNSVVNHSKIRTKSNDPLKKLEHVVAAAYITASSQNKMSCHHKKCQNGVVEDVGVRNPKISDVKLEKVLVPMDGTANIYLRLKVKGKHVDLQFRSKGSKAQFIVMESLRSTGTAFPLDKISFATNWKK